MCLRKAQVGTLKLTYFLSRQVDDSYIDDFKMPLWHVNLHLIWLSKIAQSIIIKISQAKKNGV